MVTANASLRVLLVEDDEDHADLAVSALQGAKSAEFTVDRAATGSEALSLADRFGYDTLVLDYRLGDTDGLTLLEELRHRGLLAPALLLTSRGSEEVAIRALRAGADDYLPKQEGLFGNALARAIRAIMDRRRLADQARNARDEAERLRGVIVAAQTMEHYLNNQLVLTVGYCEFLAVDPRLPEDLRAQARKAMYGALAASSTLARLRSITEYVETATSVGPILDIDRGTNGAPQVP